MPMPRSWVITSVRVALLDQAAHVGDLWRQRDFVEQAVRDVTIEGIERAETR